jgi:hypothetical protein
MTVHSSLKAAALQRATGSTRRKYRRSPSHGATIEICSCSARENIFTCDFAIVVGGRGGLFPSILCASCRFILRGTRDGGRGIKGANTSPPSPPPRTLASPHFRRAWERD